ncbi:beta-lactamase class D [Catalinimonas alkaloidigena]|uniref:beta-lactamase n=1 Tax=Catalinimonas alkaloidigena TaxID=1075417 RepID=A0A1G8WJ62_9BACT|nr:class D beta-lactamase [Catalinimonas alkaloidigena]SDJ78399.1 beta-lactamase class D [Catalinimonas alkaloidigena]
MSPLTLLTAMMFLVCTAVPRATHRLDRQSQTTERPDLAKWFYQRGVTGSFSLYDPRHDRYILVNPNQLHEAFSPASTFKICNSLIGLETGVIADTSFVIPWDGQERTPTVWNQDHSLRSAFQVSCVPYYQELARRVGTQQMQRWIDAAQYGNQNIQGGIDRFWLTGALRITPAQQLDFLQRLYENRLPFSPRTLALVKGIMLVEATDAYTLRAKTGWSNGPAGDVGWYVGYVEQGGTPYYFATCIQAPTGATPDGFGQARIDISRQMLKELDILH